MTNVQNIQGQLTPVEQWLSDTALERLYSSGYWNDIEAEKRKEWWIADGNYAKCLDFLRTSGLRDEWNVAEELILSWVKSRSGKIEAVDLASGIGWTAALLSKLDAVDVVHATEISKHRLTELFPYAVDMLDGRAEKIRRYIGSFYELGFQNESKDLIFLSQAFHHADHPLRLLVEMDRVLRPGGVIVMIGENYISLQRQLRRVLISFAKSGRWTTNFYELFPPDDEMGDHYYRLSDYYLFFQLLGYDLHHKIVHDRSLVLMASKEQSS